MPSQFYSIGPVAEQVGLPRWKLAYLIERGDVPGPSLQVPGRRLFTDEDIVRIRETLAAQRLQSSVAPPEDDIEPLPVPASS